MCTPCRSSWSFGKLCRCRHAATSSPEPLPGARGGSGAEPAEHPGCSEQAFPLVLPERLARKPAETPAQSPPPRLQRRRAPRLQKARRARAVAVCSSMLLQSFARIVYCARQHCRGDAVHPCGPTSRPATLPPIVPALAVLARCRVECLVVLAFLERPSLAQ